MIDGSDDRYERTTSEGSDRAVRVVIVDDQKPFRMAARDVIELTGGFEVVGEAETGEDALEVVKSLEPDLVLMDLNLPGIDGLEATKRILAARSKRVVVLMVSTYEAEEFAPRAAEAGAAAYISKSEFGPDQLEEAWAAASAS
ncbi:MAG: response regulator transcription factor [Actinomycetota bacterium]|nr:response regulator transcription factor [Actinomycetota bacterium]